MTEQTAAPASQPPEQAEPPHQALPPQPPQLPPVPLLPPVPVPAVVAPAPRPPRRALRAVARWTAAVLVFGAFGAGTAYALASADRGDVPGLATESDGRWDYPRLSLPALPAGAPRPFTEGNTAEVHHADLRRLLLPAPAGATPDTKLTGGWIGTEQFLAAFAKGSRADLRLQLKESAVRHIAARGWTMPDGTSTRIYLLQFNSTAFADDFRDTRYIGTTPGDALTGAEHMDLDETWKGGGKVPETSTYVFDEPKPFGAAQVREGFVVAGDTIGLVVQERKGAAGTPRVPFHQTLILQNQLLG
ncbi:hypothetical protein [Streptomyces sp. NPDC057682]|uniref:hypothetical protein n=1 Tax=Streptomyces sp. NPDC057682 TaxID=3346210 RepID=UPI0036C709FA